MRNSDAVLTRPMLRKYFVAVTLANSINCGMGNNGKGAQNLGEDVTIEDLKLDSKMSLCPRDVVTPILPIDKQFR